MLLTRCFAILLVRRTTYVMLQRRANILCWSRLRQFCAFLDVLILFYCVLFCYSNIIMCSKDSSQYKLFIHINNYEKIWYVVKWVVVSFGFLITCAVPYQVDSHEYKQGIRNVYVVYVGTWTLNSSDDIVVIWWLWIWRGLSVRLKEMVCVLCVKSKPVRWFIHASRMHSA